MTAFSRASVLNLAVDDNTICWVIGPQVFINEAAASVLIINSRLDSGSTHLVTSNIIVANYLL